MEINGGVIIAREIPVVVKEVDRRVLIVDVGTGAGLITCVRSRQWPSSQTLHSSEQRGRGLIWSSPKHVDDAEGRDREQVGDEATGGKRVKGHT